MIVLTLSVFFFSGHLPHLYCIIETYSFSLLLILSYFLKSTKFNSLSLNIHTHNTHMHARAHTHTHTHTHISWNSLVLNKFVFLSPWAQYHYYLKLKMLSKYWTSCTAKIYWCNWRNWITKKEESEALNNVKHLF